MKRKAVAFCLAVMLSATMTTGCNKAEADAFVESTSTAEVPEEITKEEATPETMTEKEIEGEKARESTEEEKTVLEKIFPEIKERFVVSNSRQVNLTAALDDEYGVVKEIRVAETDLKTDEEGTFTVTYYVTVYMDRMSDAQEAIKNNSEIAKAESDVPEKTEVISLTEKATVVSKEKADELIKNGEQVITDLGKEYVPEEEKKDSETSKGTVDKKTDTKVKENEKTPATPETKKETETQKVDTSKTPSNGSTSGTASSPKEPEKTTEEKQPSSSGSSKPSQPSSETQKPASQETHTHTWTPQTKTVHHDAEYQLVYVVDKPAWTEDIYVDQPVYETVAAVRCGCGAEFPDYSGWCAHEEYYGDVMNDFSHGSYSVVYHQIQTGTEKVYVRTDTHPEEGHMESKIVKDAYDEEVVTGYKCSGCGATK